MNHSELQNQINQVIELTLGRRPVQSHASLIQVYGAESVDIANITVALEKKFAVHIPESALPRLRTPRDFCTLVESLRNAN